MKNKVPLFWCLINKAHLASEAERFLKKHLVMVVWIIIYASDNFHNYPHENMKGVRS